MSNAINALSARIKTFLESAWKVRLMWLVCRKCSGSEFQAWGPAYENARRPSLVMLYRGKFSRPRVAERRLRRPLTSATGTHSSARYRGARPCKHLNISRLSLNVMRCGMSSQYRSSCTDPNYDSLALQNTKRCRSSFTHDATASSPLHSSWAGMTCLDDQNYRRNIARTVLCCIGPT